MLHFFSECQTGNWLGWSMLLNKYYCNDEHGGVDNDEDNDDNDEDAPDHDLDHEVSLQDLEQQLLLELRDPVGTMAVHRQLVEVRYRYYGDYMPVIMTMLAHL